MPSYYDIAVELDPVKKYLAVCGDFNCKIPNRSRFVQFYLHNELKMQDLGGDLVAGFHKRAEPFTFAPDSAKWVVELNEIVSAGTTVELSLEYEGILSREIPRGWYVNRLTAEWVELGLYGPWFPWNMNYCPFDYRLRIDNIPDYTVVGVGNAQKQGKQWMLINDQPVQDMVLTASKSFKSVISDTGLCTYYTCSEQDTVAESITEDGEWAINYFTNWLGQMKQQMDLTVILAPRNRGGGYARPGLIVMQEMDKKNFIHELAHLWWVGAEVDSWEDWLNESFAEYFALRAMGQLKGEEAFEQLIDEKREQSQYLPPIRNLQRGHKDAWSVLYNKGALLLYNLESRLGEDVFTQLMRKRVANDINTTEEFLALVADVAGKQAAEDLAGKLDS